MINPKRKKETKKIIKKRIKMAKNRLANPIITNIDYLKQPHRLNKKIPLSTTKPSQAKGMKHNNNKHRENEYIQIEKYEEKQ